MKTHVVAHNLTTKSIILSPAGKLKVTDLTEEGSEIRIAFTFPSGKAGEALVNRNEKVNVVSPL
jgi:hypothetical protein